MYRNAIATQLVQELMNELVEIPGIKTLFNWPVFKLELIRDVSDVGISTSFSTSVIVNYRQGDEAFAFQMMRRRKEKLRLFIIKLSSAVCDLSRMFSAPLTGCVPKFLSAEPHSQGERPVVIFLAESQYVIKFRDPRPYLVLQYVLGDLESSIDLKLKPPKIYFNSSFDWYAMPYLESGEPARDLLDEEVFFYRLGAITAVAYFLQMTDIHSDNLIVSDGIPVIVDPECIFYGYSEYVLNDLAGRLLSTGLAAFSPEVSAIRGGDVLVKHFGATENNGEIDYVRLKIVGRRHRLLDSLGCMVNPVKYKRVLCKGFAVAYETLCRRKEKLTAAIENITTPDTKSRILLRLTMHYATVIEMLRKISGENSDIMLGKIIATFLKSGGMSELIDEEVARCEVLDMLEADFPFFWVEDIKGKPFLMHWSGCIACMPQSDALKARIHRATMSCNINQLPVLLKTLRNFLS